MGEQLGQTLRHLRKAAGYTLEQVASAAEITPAALSLFETGKRNPSPKVLGLIAAAINYPVYPLQQLLDDERSVDRMEQAQRSADSSPHAARNRPPSPVLAGNLHASPVFTRQPIDQLFGVAATRPTPPDSKRVAWTPEPASEDLQFAERDWVYDESPAPTRQLRAVARHPGNTVSRLAAIDRLGDDASLALRTLWGLIDDDDPEVAREARRLLRELGLSPTAEIADEARED